MRVYLRDKNRLLVDAWNAVFKDEPNIISSCGDIFAEGKHLDVDAIVSPANSFGHMDGGIDFVYSEYFGWGIGTKLREILRQEHDGELLVGQAVVLDMRKTNPGNEQQTARVNSIPYLISAPTMRVPMNVSNTVNAYLAFTAALKIAKKHNFKSILCPGLGTAVGFMPCDVCAVQMYEAYKHYKSPRFHIALGNAHRLHNSMLESKTYLTSEYPQ